MREEISDQGSEGVEDGACRQGAGGLNSSAILVGSLRDDKSAKLSVGFPQSDRASRGKSLAAIPPLHGRRSRGANG